MNKNVRGIITSSKPDKSSPGAPRAFAKRGSSSVEGASKNTSTLGAGGKRTPRSRSGSALADPVPGAKAPPEKLNAPAARAIDFEAPITITVSGRLAAALRFVAYHNERTPQQEAETSLLSSLSSDLVNGIGHNDASALEWLAGRTQ